MNFPAPENRVPKKRPKCSWRQKSKPCLTCGGVITDLPKSVFITRKFCSRGCKRGEGLGRNKGEGSEATWARKAVAFMLAQFIEYHSTLNWWDSCVAAVNFMEEKDER